jgi:hypothetical protein
MVPWGMVIHALLFLTLRETFSLRNYNQNIPDMQIKLHDIYIGRMEAVVGLVHNNEQGAERHFVTPSTLYVNVS